MNFQFEPSKPIRDLQRAAVIGDRIVTAFLVIVSAILMVLFVATKPAAAEPSLWIDANGNAPLASGYVWSNGRTSGFVAPLGSAAAKIIRGPDQEGSDRDKAWFAYCQPTFRTDDFGVTHYVYKKRGCEFGRDHD